MWEGRKNTPEYKEYLTKISQPGERNGMYGKTGENHPKGFLGEQHSEYSILVNPPLKHVSSLQLELKNSTLEYKSFNNKIITRFYFGRSLLTSLCIYIKITL